MYCADLLQPFDAESTADARTMHERARQLADIATDFTPGVSLAKDLVTIATRVNPVSGHRVADVELGIIVAGVLFPGALTGVAKTAKRLGTAALKSGRVAGVAAKYLPNVQKAAEFLDALKEGATHSVAEHAPETYRRLAQFFDHPCGLVERSAHAVRNTPGVATISSKLFSSETVLRGTQNNAGLVPIEVAEKLVGRQFSKFDDFRQEFRKAKADSKYGQQFTRRDQGRMRQGLSPRVDEGTQNLGGRARYELHHIVPISEGGSVCDLYNIVIDSPQFHVKSLHNLGDK